MSLAMNRHQIEGVIQRRIPDSNYPGNEACFVMALILTIRMVR